MTPATAYKPSSGQSPSNQKNRRIFISGCNTLLGYCLVEELRNDHIEADETANQFVGTLDPRCPNDPPPENVKRVVSFSQKHNFSHCLLDSDVIVYHVSAADPAELRFAISRI